VQEPEPVLVQQVLAQPWVQEVLALALALAQV
jgi:hypothetical protein